MAVTPATWRPDSWRERRALQQPEWPEPAAAAAVVDRLRTSPPLVFAGEARALREQLAKAIDRRAFLLQAGDCVESFNEISTMRIREKLKIMLQMSAVLTYGATLPVVKVGRIAGQFTKPRSDAFELVDADLTQVHLWNKDFVASSPEGRRYERLAMDIERALAFMAACGIDLAAERRLHEVDVFTSHEGLLLDYEEGLTREDSLTGDWYDCSAHLLWVGERTRGIDDAHIEFFAGVHNPLGVKLGPAAKPEEVVELCERLNPLRVPGRLTFYARMGAEGVLELLPPLLRAVRDEGHPVLWASDPMHANTIRTSSGVKTRRFDTVMRELEGFFAACWQENVWPGGVHLEFTGEDVTECLGGADDVVEAQLSTRYETLLDPRLNARQSLDLAFRLAELMRR
jgi:3-deoxy-7-phosphoheptulonate synthase